MATPNADRLSKIESWRTSAMEDSHRHLTAVSQALDEIAAGNREVAADLGLECATARAACACLDRMTGKILEESDKLKQIVKASTDVLTAGIDARNESIEIQKRLSKVNGLFGSAKQKLSHAPGNAEAIAQIEAQRQAAHAEIEALAKKSLSKLNDRTLAAIDALPPHDQAGPTTNHTPAGSGDRRSGGGVAGGESAARPNAGTPARSATAWGASVDASLGSSGGYTPAPAADGHSSAGGSGPVGDGLAGGGSVSLQGSHYTPAQPIRPSAGPSAGPASPAVFNPLASAAAITGGATVAGYTAYQAARAARAVQTPAVRPSVVRAAGAAPTTGTGRSASIVRGATTAVRTSTTGTARSASIMRGGATGIARPVPPNTARSASIVRGATTAVRTPTTGTARSASIVRGATTAVRTPTSSPASAGRPGGRTPTRNSGARILTGGRTPIPNGTGSPRGAGPSSRQAEARNASRSGARQSEARSGSASRALHNLTGRPDKKKTRRQSNEPTQSLPVSAYEEDKTVTFLPAGCRREDNNTPPR